VNTTLLRLAPPVAVLTAIGLSIGSPALAVAGQIRSEGPLTSYSSTVPSGATARVQAVYDASGATTVTLHVWGLQPDTTYGAHAHNNPCGLTGSAAGSHYQNDVDPVQPSVDPAYANSANEIWLDLTTDAEGNGTAQTRVNWQFSPERRAHSVIIHVNPTSTDPGSAGTAGARLACLTVNF